MSLGCLCCEWNKTEIGTTIRIIRCLNKYLFSLNVDAGSNRSWYSVQNHKMFKQRLVFFWFCTTNKPVSSGINATVQNEEWSYIRLLSQWLHQTFTFIVFIYTPRLLCCDLYQKCLVTQCPSKVSPISQRSLCFLFIPFLSFTHWGYPLTNKVIIFKPDWTFQPNFS